jgi:UDP-glucose 4-epimerase
MILEGSKILVTGGSGYIGNNLIRRLSAKNCEIVSINNTKIPDICPNLNVTNFLCDLEDPNSLSKVIKDSDFDYVYHLAAKSNANPLEHDYSNTIKFNVNSTVNVLKNIRHKKVKRFFFTSSSSVYTSNKSISFDERMLLNPNNAYGVSKLCCEQIIYSYAKNYNIPSLALRLGSVFGENDSNLFHLIPSIMISLKNSKNFLLKSDPSKIIDLVYMEHLCDFMLDVGNLSQGKTFDVINFSSYQTSINEIINLLENLFKKKLIFEIKKERNTTSNGLMSLSLMEKFHSNHVTPSLNLAIENTYHSFVGSNSSL